MAQSTYRRTAKTQKGEILNPVGVAKKNPYKQYTANWWLFKLDRVSTVAQMVKLLEQWELWKSKNVIPDSMISRVKEMRKEVEKMGGY